jgi:hypothetical protein
MKIGDVEIKKIPAAQCVECNNGCSAKAIAYYNGTPYCAGCLREEQQLKWDEDGNFFENSDGDRVYFEVVRKSS